MNTVNIPKAIILDLDNTLLHSDGTISGRTLLVLEECKRRGILIVVATARFWFKAEKYLDIIMPDYAILADGTQIYHGSEMIHGFPMEIKQSNEVIRELMRRSSEAEFVVSIGQKLLCSTSGVEERWRHSNDFRVALDIPVYKIAAIMGSYREAEGLAARYSCRLYSYRGENLYGFTSRKAGKYQAVCALGEILKINLEDMISFGDDENDYEILKYCGRGIAVANAVPMIKEISDETTESNDEDGVAKYLERAVLKI